MYLSQLLVNIGDNPDRPRPGRLWLRNLYHVHQRLCMAFPSASRKKADPDFLQPYCPMDFREGDEDDHVHKRRDQNRGFLFRIEPVRASRSVILVQSAIEPDWEYAFHNADYLLAAPVACSPYNPVLLTGGEYRFRLTANPTRKIGTKSEPDGKRNNGKRVPVAEDKLIDWLADSLKLRGAALDRENLAFDRKIFSLRKKCHADDHKIIAITFDGSMQVESPDDLLAAITSGIGSSKGFGCGLLSLVPKQ
jgi:CRISPR system Cascade subunit CasE